MAQPPATNAPAQYLALIADDDPMVGVLAGEVLQPAGFRVVTISHGTDVPAAFDHYNPDIVLLDVEMPGANGFDVCTQIRATPRGATIPIVMVTGRDDTSSIRRAYEAGATDFMVKPVAWNVLPHRVSFLIRAYETTNALRQSEQQNKALLHAFPDWLFIVTPDGKVLRHLSAVAHPSGSRFVGKMIEACLPALSAQNAREAMRAVIESGTPQDFEFTAGSGDAERAYETRVQVPNEDGYLFVVRDITERQRAEARIQYLAYYDTLTGLPNRQLFVRELRRAIAVSTRKNSNVAILFIDLDRFKRINDTLGHAVGDALLQSVARRLESCLRPDDVVARTHVRSEQTNMRLARLGGDEFVILLTDLTEPSQAATVATRVRHVLAEPFTSDGHQYVVTPSIGISLYPDDGNDVDDLLLKADMAMYEAKGQGRNRHAFFSNSMSGRSLDRLDLENELRQAISKGDFSLHYQPKVDARTGAIDAVEALLRWHHPERGWISPGTFIPVAEEPGMMLPLGDWVIREACRQVSAWARAGVDRLCVAVNVSVQQFARDTFVDTVLSTVNEFQISPDSLELEITESLLMRNIDEVIAALTRLRGAGVKISIDDFGTGYSSLGYLRQFPVDTLKIDRSFVKDLHVSSDDAAICAAIIAMARELNLTTVAEGVELTEQLEFLRRHGCNKIQGFLFSKPLPANALEKLLKRTRTIPIIAADAERFA